MLKFKRRAHTDYMCFTFKNLGDKTSSELRKEAKCKGEFEVGWHFLVHQDGFIEMGRDDKAWAGIICPCDYKVTLWVMIDRGSSEVLTEHQKDSLEYLHSLFPESTIIWDSDVKEEE